MNFKLSERDEWAYQLGHNQAQEEIARLRAEVNRRGNILLRCLTCMHELYEAPRGSEMPEYDRLTEEIGALTDED